MVMLTLAAFVLEKFGGDNMDDVRESLARYRARIATAPAPPVAGGRQAVGTGHGLTGTDEAGSGGDD
jgi:hypothetical protein